MRNRKLQNDGDIAVNLQDLKDNYNFINFIKPIFNEKKIEYKTEIPLDLYSTYDIGMTAKTTPYRIEIKDRSKKYNDYLIDVFKVSKLLEYKKDKCQIRLVVFLKNNNEIYVFNLNKIDFSKVKKEFVKMPTTTLRGVKEYEPKEMYHLDWKIAKKYDFKNWIK